MAQLVNADQLRNLIRDIPNFPVEGIIFRDITPVLKHPLMFHQVVHSIRASVRLMHPDLIVGIESRGFMLATPVAMDMGLGFVPARKPGKLPYDVESIEYSLEYGTACLEIHKDAIQPGMRVVIVDDLLATGGTSSACCQLIEKLGGTVVGLSYMIELEELHGRDKLKGYHIDSILKYKSPASDSTAEVCGPATSDS